MSPFDADAIRARIPHRGRMALLERADAWDETSIHCQVADHRRADHPLRGRHGLLATAAVEFAAQAAALHQALVAEARGAAAAARPGFIASARDLRLHRLRLDELEGALQLHAERVLAADRQAQYRFTLADRAGAPLAEGRLTVVLDTPLVAPAGATAPASIPTRP